MRLIVLGVAIAACTTAAPPPVVAPITPPAALPAAPAIDQAAVIANSHAFFDAFDRADVDAATASMAPSFVWFDAGRQLTGEMVSRGLQARIDRHAPIHSRTWDDEHVYLSPNAAVFIGHAIEHLPSEGAERAADEDGYNTLVWARDGEHWRIVMWQWTLGGIEAERQFWNDRFRVGAGFNHEPNQLLVDAIKGHKPGTALDVAMGQGRNAIYLASQGWKTTGVDISDEGMRQAREAAAKRKLALETVSADIDTWDFGKDRWDLVTLIYAGDDAKLVDKIKPSLRKGGLFICEYFHADSDAAKAGAGGWPTGKLASLFASGYTILRDDVVDDTADYSLRKQKLVRFVAQKL
jgi:ketosteroid isomerase-like protein